MVDNLFIPMLVSFVNYVEWQTKSKTLGFLSETQSWHSPLDGKEGPSLEL